MHSTLPTTQCAILNSTAELQPPPLLLSRGAQTQRCWPLMSFDEEERHYSTTSLSDCFTDFDLESRPLISPSIQPAFCDRAPAAASTTSISSYRRQSHSSGNLSIQTTMMWDEHNRAIPVEESDRPGNTYDMAYFLKTTGPPTCTTDKCDLSREHRNKRKKLMPQLPPMFGRKKKDIFEISSRPIEDMIAPLVVQRVSKGGAKYYQIVAPRSSRDYAEDIEEVRMSGELFRPGSQDTAMSRAKTNLGAVDTEDMHNFFDTFQPMVADSTSNKENVPVLQAKAFPGLITQEESLTAKGPSMLSSNGNGDCEFGLTAFERLSTRAMSPIDWSDLTVRASMMQVDDMSCPTTPQRQAHHMPSIDTLTNVSPPRSGTKRSRSEELSQAVETASARDSIENAVLPRRGQHNRELSVLNLDPLLKNNIATSDFSFDLSQEESDIKAPSQGRERPRPAPLLLDPTMSANSSFESQADTIVPELDRGLSSSEESFGDMPKTPTPSPKVRRQPKFRLTPTPPRQSIRNSTQAGPTTPFHFSYPYPSSPSRVTATRAVFPTVPPRPATSGSNSIKAANFPTSKFMRNAYPAPSFPLPPTPPRTASPHRNNSTRSSATAVPNSQRSSMASTIATTPRSSRRQNAARLAAQLESVTHEKELLQAALNAVLLTNGKLNKCPCTIKSAHSPSPSADHAEHHHQHHHHHSNSAGQQSDTPSSSQETEPMISRPTSLTTTVQSRLARNSDSAASVLSSASAGSSISALETYMATRREPEVGQWRASEATVTN